MKSRFTEKLPYRELSGISAARTQHSGCFYFCAALMLSTYAYTFAARVLVTEILLERQGEEARLFASDVLKEGSELFDERLSN